jgi:hypothetical protein
MLQTQAGPVDMSEQITDPIDLGTSSVILPEQTVTIPPQGKAPITESLPMNLFINYNHSWKFSIEDIPSAASAGIVPASSSHQRQEIALKQVCRAIHQILHYQYLSWVSLSFSFSRSKILPIVCFPLLSTSLMTKAKKQAPQR